MVAEQNHKDNINEAETIMNKCFKNQNTWYNRMGKELMEMGDVKSKPLIYFLGKDMPWNNVSVGILFGGVPCPDWLAISTSPAWVGNL